MSYNVKGRRLAEHPGAQCRVQVYDDGTMKFVSYYTTVITAIPYHVASVTGKLTRDMFQKSEEHLDADCYLLLCQDSFSRTTKQQVRWFLEEYFPTITVDDMRQSYKNDEYIIAHRLG